MRIRTLGLLSLLVVVSCQLDKSTRPVAAPPSPFFVISDGAHSGGNPDFFFLPEMVANPNGNPNYEAGAFNPSLLPAVHVCSLTGNSEGQIDASTPCSGNYETTIPAAVNTGSEQYRADWTVPNAADVFYRVSVRVGTKVLGYADVETGKNSGQLKNVNTGEFIPRTDGSSLPVKFRIERYALCAVPGVGPCASSNINLGEGGIVQTELEGVEGGGGVNVPPQSNSNENRTVTAEPCADMNPRAIDLPTFGPCVSVTVDPPLPPSGLAEAATVFICDINPLIPDGMTDSQHDRITLHRLDVVGSTNEVTALPHAHACEEPTATAAVSLKGVFASLLRGELRSAGRQVAALVSPRPLYAARRVDVGGGGETELFSDFQFALPAKVEKYSGDGQVVAPGATIATTVLVTDLGGEPVQGATVHFATSDGSVAPTSGVTDADGFASSDWTVPGTTGNFTMTASGRGLGGADFDGPRAIFDPFQPIQPPFDLAGPATPVAVLTGSQIFTASVAVGPVNPFDFGSSGYDYLMTNSPPAGWQTVGFVPTGWLSGSAAFGAASNQCSISQGGFGTEWRVSDPDLLVRKSFVSPIAGTLALTVLIDNDAQIFLDGVNISATGAPSGSTSKLDAGNVADPSDDWWTHNLCADGFDYGQQNSFHFPPPVFSVPISAGAHVLAIRAHNRAHTAYFDVKGVITP